MHLCEKMISTQIMINAISTVSTKLQKKYNWLSWIKISGHPFIFVDIGINQKLAKMAPVCSKTLRKYLEAVTEKTERNISESMPQKIEF